MGRETGEAALLLPLPTATLASDDLLENIGMRESFGAVIRNRFADRIHRSQVHLEQDSRHRASE